MSRRLIRSRHGHSLPLARLFPNMVTLGALCCGVSSIRFAMLEMWHMSVALILIAALLDSMDGFVARLLRATSPFGAQLDSLSDMVSFGVAPAIITYLWLLDDIKRWGWAAVLFYIVCCALRLARFNVHLADEQSPAHRMLMKRFFVGIPSPAGAILALMPLVLTFKDITIFEGNHWYGVVYLALVGLLMASRIPTFAPKHWRIPQWLALPVMLAAGMLCVGIISEPWMTLMLTMLLYISSIPFSVWKYRRAVRALHHAE